MKYGIKLAGCLEIMVTHSRKTWKTCFISWDGTGVFFMAHMALKKHCVTYSPKWLSIIFPLYKMCNLVAMFDYRRVASETQPAKTLGSCPVLDGSAPLTAKPAWPQCHLLCRKLLQPHWRNSYVILRSGGALTILNWCDPHGQNQQVGNIRNITCPSPWGTGSWLELIIILRRFSMSRQSII